MTAYLTDEENENTGEILHAFLIYLDREGKQISREVKTYWDVIGMYGGLTRSLTIIGTFLYGIFGQPGRHIQSMKTRGLLLSRVYEKFCERKGLPQNKTKFHKLFGLPDITWELQAQYWTFMKIFRASKNWAPNNFMNKKYKT